MMKILFLLLPILYIVGNAYVYVRMLHSMAFLPLWGKIVVSVVYWVVAFALVVSLVGRDKLPSVMQQVLYVAGSIWLVANFIYGDGIGCCRCGENILANI